MAFSKREMDLMITMGLDVSKLKKSLGEADKQLDNFSKKITAKDIAGKLNKIGNSLTLLSVPLIAFGKSAFTAFAGFEQQMYSLSSVMGEDRTGAVIAELEKKIRELGSSTVYSSAEIAGAAELLAQAGLKSDEVNKSLEKGLTFAQASRLSVEDSTGILLSTMGQFGKSIDDIEAIGDALVYTGDAGQTSVDELGKSLKNSGVYAKVANTSLEETLALLNEMAKTGRKGEVAGSQLGSTFKYYSRLTSEFNSQIESGKKLEGVYKQLSDAGVKKIDGSLLDFIETLKSMKKNMSDAEFSGMLQKIFLDNAAFIETMVNDTSGALNQFANDVRTQSQGISESVAAIMGETPEAKVKKLKNAFDELKITFGELISDTVLDNIQSFTNMIKDLTEKFNNMSPAMKSFVEGFFWFIILIGPAIKIISSIVSAVGMLNTAFTWLSTGGMTKIIGVFSKIWSFLVSTPFLIVALVAVLVWMGGQFEKKWDELHSGISIMRQGFADVMNDLRDKLGFFGNFITFLFDLVGTTVTNLFAGLVEALAGIFNIVKGILTGDMERVKHGFKQIGYAIANVFIGIANAGIRAFNSLLKTVNKVLDWINERTKGGLTIAGFEIIKAKKEGLLGGFQLGLNDELSYLDAGKYVSAEEKDKKAKAAAMTRVENPYASLSEAQKKGLSGYKDNLLVEKNAPPIPDVKPPPASNGDNFTFNVDKMVAGDEKDAEKLVKDMDKIKNGKKAGQGYNAAAANGGC